MQRVPLRLAAASRVTAGARRPLAEQPRREALEPMQAAVPATRAEGVRLEESRPVARPPAGTLPPRAGRLQVASLPVVPQPAARWQAALRQAAPQQVEQPPGAPREETQRAEPQLQERHREAPQLAACRRVAAPWEVRQPVARLLGVWQRVAWPPEVPTREAQQLVA
jgi:hypothetical protein